LVYRLITGPRDSWSKWAFYRDERSINEKEEFPGFMENMLPGNSFPQICVVSVHKSGEND
jgi:hypothetical protein